jgi:hypothetical protein
MSSTQPSSDAATQASAAHAGTEGRAPGPDPGSGWLVQEITERLPGRV